MTNRSSSIWLSIRAAVRAHDAAVIVVADTELSVAQIMVLLDMGAELAVAVKVLSSELRVLTDIAGQPADRVLGVPWCILMRHGMTGVWVWSAAR